MRFFTAMILAAALATSAGGAPGGDATGGDATGGDTPGAAGAFATTDALLDALETADRSIETFHSDIIYERYFALQEDRHTRGGDLYFRVERAPGDDGGERSSRTFAVHFEWLMLDNEKRDAHEAWMFNGQWLVEKRFEQKQYVAHEIARPGQRIDPLRLGEGPLPIPIGQRKADILSRYEAEILPTADGFDPDDPRHASYKAAVMKHGAVQLRLTPLTGRVDDDGFQTIRLWYVLDVEGRLLPMLSRTVDRKGDESFVLLANVEVNVPLPVGVIDISEPPVEAGWDVQYERLRTNRVDADAGPGPGGDAGGDEE